MKYNKYKDDIKQTKSKEFAVLIVEFSKKLRKRGVDYAIVQQLLKSSTSIGANIRESKRAQSSNDFIAKCTIALKEAEESSYWVEILYETDYITDDEFDFYHSCSEELIRIIHAVIVSKQRNMKK